VTRSPNRRHHKPLYIYPSSQLTSYGTKLGPFPSGVPMSQPPEQPDPAQGARPARADMPQQIPSQEMPTHAMLEGISREKGRNTQ
jgi:hypothetical protein